MPDRVGNRIRRRLVCKVADEQQHNVLGPDSRQHDEVCSAKRTSWRRQWQPALGHGVSNGAGCDRRRSGNGQAPAKRGAAKVKAKYRDPKTKETWSGAAAR